ncbi:MULTISPECIES: hypothetical protein [Streptosporangium]|uniref:Uncharacterized protein n=1 Tax=Streptosporangium brasiliense TaxID=47480 RepID=A0ABT9R1B7_9ACTN|nr:hypothetical protein [Streptosporangium brasiliense]MDP9863026.1 hypothetical protein [Streptosporangium brasiliense]
MPGAPPWQPPPAFTAAAAGMQVWPSSPDAPGTPQWPAATGEPVWSDSDETAAGPGGAGDVAAWPPDPDGLDENTVNVRAAMPAVPGHQGPASPPPPPGPDPHAHASGAVSGPVPPSGPDAALTPPGPDVSTAPTAAGAGAQPPVPLPAPGAATQPSMPAPAAQSPASQPEPTPQVPPLSAASVTGTPAPSPAPADQSADSAARSPEPEMPALPPPPGDQPTPPGGIPMIAPPFPNVPASAAPQSGPSTGVMELRGPFTPPSAVVSEVVAAPPAPPGRSRTATLLIAAVVAVVVGGIGTGAFFAYQSFSGKETAGAAPSAVSTPEAVDPTEDPAPDEPEPVNTTMLNSEKTDPGKMTVADAFSKKVTLAGTTFVRVKTDVTQQCQKAAAGKFASALRSKDCRRVLRATYVDSKRKYAVTTGIAVLPTRESAVEVDQAKNLGSNLWFRGLPGTPGTGAERVHIAGGYAAGLVWGRYIVFSYATFSDGHTPTAKEKNLGKVSGAFRDQTTKVIERRVTS